MSNFSWSGMGRIPHCCMARAPNRLDGFTLIVFADFVDDHGMGGDLVPLHIRVQHCTAGRLLDFSTQRRPKGFRQFDGHEKGSDCRDHMGISRPGVEQRPALLPVDSNVFSNPSHRCSGKTRAKDPSLVAFYLPRWTTADDQISDCITSDPEPNPALHRAPRLAVESPPALWY